MRIRPVVGSVVLLSLGRIPEQTVVGGAIDLALGALFVVAWLKTAPGTDAAG